jgi:hypothetical protein
MYKFIYVCIDYDESNRVDLHPDEMMMEEDYDGMFLYPFEYVFMFLYIDIIVFIYTYI